MPKWCCLPVAGARFVRGHPVLAALGPAGGQGQRFRGVGLVARVGRAFVEEHGDVRAERALDFHAELGGEQHFRAVEVVLETHALLGDFPEFRQRPDLEAAGVGEHRLLPGGEAVKSAELADQFMAGPQPEVVGVSEDDLGSELLDFRRMQGFDRPLGADRHENRRFHRAMGQNQAAAAGGAGRIGGEKGEGHGRAGGNRTEPLPGQAQSRAGAGSRESGGFSEKHSARGGVIASGSPESFRVI